MIKIILIAIALFLIAFISLIKANKNKKTTNNISNNNKTVKQANSTVKKQIAIIVGHNSIKKGAYSEILKKYEFDYWNEVAKKIVELKPEGLEIDIYNRQDVKSYSKEMQAVISITNSKKYDIVLELHFNSAGSPQANGVEVLCLNDNKVKDFGIKFCQLAKEKFESNIRNKNGLKLITTQDRGAYGIYHSTNPYILTELFFGSSFESTKFIDINKVAKFYIELLREA